MIKILMKNQDIVIQCMKSAVQVQNTQTGNNEKKLIL